MSLSISVLGMRKLALTGLTTFSSCMRLSKSFAPKRIATWPIFTAIKRQGLSRFQFLACIYLLSDRIKIHGDIHRRDLSHIGGYSGSPIPDNEEPPIAKF
jgi:hypothetical protein